MTAASSGCLVLSVNPGYDETTIGWDPNLIGHWVDADDKATLQIDRGEWKSYRIHYVHPIETGDLTGYLTAIGNERYLDVMPARGEDRGSFLLPLHAMLHLRLDGDRLELTPLSYEWFGEQLRAGRPIPGLSADARSERERAPRLARRSLSGLAARTIRRRPCVRGVGDVCAKALALRRRWESEERDATADSGGVRGGGSVGGDAGPSGSEPQRGRVHALRAARARDRVVQDHLRRHRRVAGREVLLQSDPASAASPPTSRSSI